MKLDCHFHTRLSDWALTSKEIFDMTKKWFRLLIPTDHDLINTEIRDLIFEETGHQNFLWTEISIYDTNPTAIIWYYHLVAYANEFNSKISHLLSQTREWKIIKIKEQIKLLKTHWFNLYEELFIKHYSELWYNIENLNSYHISKYLYDNKDNQEIITGIFWHFPIFDNFIKECFKERWKYKHIWKAQLKPYTPTIQAMWSIIDNLNGILWIAHPHISFSSIDDFEKFVKINKKFWLNSIEIQTSMPIKWIRNSIELSKKFNLFLTFWSDFHSHKSHNKLGQLNSNLSDDFVWEQLKRIVDKINW